MIALVEEYYRGGNGLVEQIIVSWAVTPEWSFLIPFLINLEHGWWFLVIHHVVRTLIWKWSKWWVVVWGENMDSQNLPKMVRLKVKEFDQMMTRRMFWEEILDLVGQAPLSASWQYCEEPWQCWSVQEGQQQFSRCQSCQKATKWWCCVIHLNERPQKELLLGIL